MPLLNFQQVGQGNDIILIHGLFGSLENLAMVAKGLKDNYRVTSVDVRNHGASFHAPSMHYDECAQDIYQLMAHLNIEKAHILGHSMGGKVAMAFAVKYPNKVHKLMVADIAPVAYPPHHQHIISGLQQLDLAQLANRKAADIALSHHVEDKGVRQFLLRNLAIDKNQQLYFKCNLDHIEACYSQIMSGMDDSVSFDGATLFIKGGASDYIKMEHSELIKKLFPKSKAKIIQGAGHWLHAEKTTAFNRIVINFLQS